MHKLKLHFLGIGGSGASAAAAIAQAQGYEVTGCDNDPHSEFLKPFTKKRLFVGHNPKHLTSHSTGGKAKIDLLIVTPAIFSLDPNNPELVTAKSQNIPILTWQQFVGEYLMKNKFVIAIAGTHGKSTTTAMIALMMEEAGLNPTIILGAVIPKWGTNYRVSHRHPEQSEGSLTNVSSNQLRDSSPSVQNDKKTNYFVVEADEFNDNFLFYTPDISVVTTVEMDHPEYFKDLDAVKQSFKKFLEQTKQTIIANLNDPNIAAVILGNKVTPESRSWTSQDDKEIKLVDYSKKLIDFPLKVPGQYNILNASAAYQVGLELKIDSGIIKTSLYYFTGAARRFEIIGAVNGAEIYSDFGHHPTEIKVTIEAARQKFPQKKLWVIFQPHMFARTKGLFEDFVKVFKELPVDGVAIFDIYPSREIDTGIISSKQLVEAINQKNVEYAASWTDFQKVMKNMLSEKDVVFFMGAGDTDKWAKELVS